MVFTEEFLLEALAYLKDTYPKVHDAILTFEKTRNFPLQSKPTTMFTRLASAVIYQKVKFAHSTKVKAKITDKVGYIFTSSQLAALGREWFNSKELDMDAGNAKNLWSLIEYCQEHGDPITPDDVIKIGKCVKGVGEWTVTCTILNWSICSVPKDMESDLKGWSKSDVVAVKKTRRLQLKTDVAADLVVAWDPVIRKGLYNVLGKEMYTGTMRELKKGFGKYGGVVSLYMWWMFNHKRIALPSTYRDWKLVNPRTVV